MKSLFAAIVLSLLVCSVCRAQHIQVGVRAGASLTDYSIGNKVFDSGIIGGGRVHAGFETALLARFSFARRMFLQAEFEYNRDGYEFMYTHGDRPDRNIIIDANRIEIPLMLGVKAGPVHFFAGAYFRISHSEKSSAPGILKVGFNNSDVALAGGAGVSIRRFFIDARVMGYPRATMYNNMTVAGQTRRVTVARQLRWSLSAGVLF